MIIIKESIKDHDKELGTLANNLMGLNYVVWLRARTFNFSTADGNQCFTLQNLEELFTNPQCDPVRGTLEPSTPEESIAYINNALGHNASYQKIPEGSEQLRCNVYWAEIARHFILPPTQVYTHEAYEHSFFGGWVFWRFCYVYINDKNGTGIVIDGGAAD